MLDSTSFDLESLDFETACTYLLELSFRSTVQYCSAPVPRIIMNRSLCDQRKSVIIACLLLNDKAANSAAEPRGFCDFGIVIILIFLQLKGLRKVVPLLSVFRVSHF